MNDKHRESLSAFLDGELTDSEAIEALVRQSGCSKAFGSLCEQRDALHGQINNSLPLGFAEQVAKAVADEPAILSPAPSRTDAPIIERKGEVVQGWFGGKTPTMAIAASVAALGFVGLVMFNEGRQQAPEYVAQAPSAPVTVAGSIVAETPALSVRQDAVLQVTSDVRSIDMNSLSPQLRSLMIQHLEAARRAQQTGAQPSSISFQPGN